MPRAARTRFVRKKRQTVQPAEPLQCCVVCYVTFHPYPVAPSRWASSMTKVFYKALNIPPFQTGGDEEGDEDDVLLSLPYCPECHSKISLMFSLYTQLEIIQNQYACIRNEIAFIVVETIDSNCRNGPMDFIRQQIYEKWHGYHAEESSKENYRDVIGLDAILALNYVGMNDMSDNFPTDNDDTQSESEGEETNLDNVPGAAEDFQPATNMMEVEYDENTGYDQRMEGSNTPLAPNAVHVIRKRQSKRASTVVASAASLAVDEQNLDLYSNLDEDKLLNDDESVNSLNALDQSLSTPARGRRLNSKHSMPRLLPMGPSGGRKGAQSSLAESAGLNANGNFRGRGRGRGRGFRSSSSRFVSQRNSSAVYNNFEDAMGQEQDVYDFNTNGDQEQLTQQTNLPRLLSKPLRGRPPGKVSEYPGIKPLLRYPKRNSSRRQRMQNELSEQGVEIKREHVETDEAIADNVRIEDPAGVYACVLCPKFYTNPGRLLRHESLCHPSLKSIHCDVCGKGFSSRLTLRRHVTNLHPDIDDGTKKCGVCGKSFRKQYSLDLHMKSHKGMKKGKRAGGRKQRAPPSLLPPPLIPAVATRSPRKARDSASLSLSNGDLLPGVPEFSTPEKIKYSDFDTGDNDTIGLGSASSEKDNLTCGICHKTFPYRTLLNMHFTQHAARKSFKCESCNITFASYAEIKSHNDEAHRIKALPCAVCGLTFSGADSLQRHLKGHEIKQERQEITESHETEN